MNTPQKKQEEELAFAKKKNIIRVVLVVALLVIIVVGFIEDEHGYLNELFDILPSIIRALF